MVNPFDLRGPEFLVFYFVLGVAVTAAVLALRHRGEPPGLSAGPLTDYLKIAYLRGGSAEAIRVASVALMDRGLLEVVDAHHLKAATASVPTGLHLIEAHVMQACRAPVRASGLLDDTTLNAIAANDCEPQLIRAGLLPDDRIKATWRYLRVVALLLLGSVAVLKIGVALSRGRTNIVFLVVLSAIFGVIVHFVTNPVRTAAGNAMLADLRTLFAALERRAGVLRPGPDKRGNELALLAAVFGAGAVPGGAVLLERLFRKPQRPRSPGSCGSTSGSSCGSGSGSSCGSSCGGGGCGGGCGGCGS
ncbi:MAG TPA: TIGR04222 domain-containing membrane protein [Vicinamibacterales bacterium]|nr:TIGR04222 domain-containing membrane protein [Vicinamibacterales bacterium]